jgi:hypothetical protein
MEQINAKKLSFRKDAKRTERRKRAILRLENQLKTDGGSLDEYLKNDEKDKYQAARKRIEKEIKTLKERV